MRSLLLVVGVLIVAAAGCRGCGANEATPVTVRVKNTSADPIFVDVSDQSLGVEIQRKVGFDWFSFVEEPPCACLACESACTCVCDAGTPPGRVVKLRPGEARERSWNGVVQVSGKASCGTLAGGRDCLSAENAPAGETFRAKLCYASSVAGYVEPPDAGADAGLPSEPGTIDPANTTCVTREFQVQDGVVELSPEPGQSCTTHEDCHAVADGGALCFSGACTTACPANAFPTVGADWQVSVLQPSDEGFFVHGLDGGQTLYQGTGTLTSVRYLNNTTRLYLSRADAGNGSLDVALPTGYAVPFNAGETLSVLVVDASSSSYGNRAVVVRDATGQLLLAADVAQGGALLAPSQTAPFAVSRSGPIIGCDQVQCGKLLHFSTRFAGDGGTPVDLDPGKSVELVQSGATFRLLNVADQSYAKTICAVPQLMPYAILNERVPQ